MLLSGGETIYVGSMQVKGTIARKGGGKTYGKMQSFQGKDFAVKNATFHTKSVFKPPLSPMG